jgi:hypothetical protein
MRGPRPGRSVGATHLAIGLDAVLKAVELPAGISDLDTGLADVDGDDLTHGGVGSKKARAKEAKGTRERVA